MMGLLRYIFTGSFCKHKWAQHMGVAIRDEDGGLKYYRAVRRCKKCGKVDITKI